MQQRHRLWFLLKAKQVSVSCGVYYTPFHYFVLSCDAEPTQQASEEDEFASIDDSEIDGYIVQVQYI